ncbi:haloalkane dehalogenase [Quadrisphaera oryzae]|uniref:haloalkane dehalogenase n=1 Tax=Quadrisphaera TaxID=317661 RepID=UPI001645451E|nr:haloalkane dehalogenase [Quadrisphaera sp. RL12-1S]MBC3761251.1 haloalkane dehalogenase [Quadrisphaera sp. RL12-1S]
MSSVDVLGTSMAYREAGRGRPVVLLHGNPTSSWLWRHVLARATAEDTGARWVAPDLIGMGASAKPDLSYSFGDHAAHLDAFIEALGLDDVVLVGHDWGVALALDHLRRHPDRVRAVALMEGHLRPLAGWEDFDDGGRDLFQRLRTPGVGERMVLEEDFFLSTLLPAALVRSLPDDELAVYRAPYPDAASRRPLLAWARQVPVAGAPAAVATAMVAALEHLSASAVPTLLLHGTPGVLVTERTVAWCREHVPGLEVVDVGGPAGHFLPEDCPAEVAEALARWVAQLP